VNAGAGFLHPRAREGVETRWARARSAEMASRYGTETPVLDWRERLIRSRCGRREVDMVLTETRR
jgi:hypothetical protein